VHFFFNANFDEVYASMVEQQLSQIILTGVGTRGREPCVSGNLIIERASATVLIYHDMVLFPSNFRSVRNTHGQDSFIIHQLSFNTAMWACLQAVS